MPQRFTPTRSAFRVAAVLSPGERPSVEAAGNGCFTLIPRDSFAEAIRCVREQPVDAILVSVHRVAGEPAGTLQHLVESFPSIPTVALVSRIDPAAPDALLRLGAHGVREVVDVTGPLGWTRLRQMVGAPSGRSAARILGPLHGALPVLPEDARRLLDAMVRRAPEVSVVRRFAREMGVRPSTLVSRFGRAGLPSPKTYLAAVRLLYAADLLEAEGMAIADVAYRLEYSSPQSFGRHLRSTLGLTSSEFRRRFPFPAAMGRFLDVLVTPYQGIWEHFHPLLDAALAPGAGRAEGAERMA